MFKVINGEIDMPVGYFENVSKSIHSWYQATPPRMLHKITLYFHLCIFIMFSFSDVLNNFKFLVGFSITTFHDSLILSSVFSLKNIVIALSVIVIIVSLIYVSTIVYKTITVKLSVGKSPLGRLTIAYKFTEAGVIRTEGVINETKRLFPGKRIIQLNYSDDKVNALGIAFGAVLNEEGSNPSDDIRLYLYNNDYRLFFIPAISHAVFAVCPIISWLVPTYWIAILSLYPKMFQFCQKKNLSAYPMIEVLDKDSLTIIAPLAQQNDFVVMEAEDIMSRSNLNCSVDTSIHSSFASSLFDEKLSRTKSFDSAIPIRKSSKKKLVKSHKVSK